MPISSRVHGILDYIVGLALIAAPWLFGFVNFDQFEAATWTPIVIGSLIIGLSLITNYETSLAKIVPLRMHLAMDALVAVILAASPWLFGFSEYVYLPHVIVGVAELLIVAMSDRAAYNYRRDRDQFVESHI